MTGLPDGDFVMFFLPVELNLLSIGQDFISETRIICFVFVCFGVFFFFQNSEMFGVFVKSIVQLNLEQNFQECGVKSSKIWQPLKI